MTVERMAALFGQAGVPQPEEHSSANRSNAARLPVPAQLRIVVAVFRPGTFVSWSKDCVVMFLLRRARRQGNR
jgi:hypothetical protein